MGGGRGEERGEMEGKKGGSGEGRGGKGKERKGRGEGEEGGKERNDSSVNVYYMCTVGPTKGRN